MNTKTDAELIQEYAQCQSETAFAELVNRHLGLVYGSALRQVQRQDVAEDVAQAVFLLLARKASAMRREVILSGWLFRTTRFLAARALRGEHRRQHREQEAAVMNLQNQSSPLDDNLWLEISPHLDDAVAALAEPDRRVVLLRFFERKPLREVGGQLGVSEEAAKKRVSRALDKMRAFLTGRGISLSTVALGTVLFETRAQATPTGLAQTICATVTAGTVATSAVVASLVTGGVRELLWLKARSLLPWAVGVAALIIGTSVMLSHREPGSQIPVALETRENETIDVAPTATASPAAQSVAAAANLSERHLFLSIYDRVENKPVVGARVLAQVWGSGKVERANEQTTGSDGAIALRVPDESFTTYRVWLAAPGYVPLVMDWQSHEFQASDVFYNCRLTRGAKLTGEVRDDAGQPVVGAKINFNGPRLDMTKRENISFHNRFSTITTDETGRFQSDQMPPEWEGGGSIAVGVSHPDFALELFWFKDANSLTTNHVVVMKKGFALRGLVVGLHGDPVAGASLQEDEKMFGLGKKTDAMGRFEFPHVQVGSYTLTVRAKGYAELKKTLLAETNAPEVTLRLEAQEPDESLKPKPLRLIGAVVDAENNEPVTRFRVLLNERRGVSDRLLGESANGAFDWPVELQFVSRFSLLIEAEGYEPQESDVRSISEAEQRFEFRLKRGSDLSGVVIQPNGQPAVRANIGLASVSHRGLTLKDGGQLVNHGHAVNRTATDENGRFTLRTMVGAERVLVVHPSGCAVLAVARVTNVFISLQPWGEITGQVFVGSNPAANQPVNVGFGKVADEEGLIPFDYNTTTDAEGGFRFIHMPPGVHFVQRLIKFYKGQTGSIGFSHGVTATVRPGETNRVVLGGKGIAVTGQLEMSPPLENYDWSLDLHALVQERQDIPEVRWEDFRGDHQAHMRAWALREAQIAKYYLVIQPDGSFRTDDVLAGNYTLKITIKAPPEDPLADDAWMKPRRDIGKVLRSVVISETDISEPMNVGVVTIPITNSAPAKHRAE